MICKNRNCGAVLTSYQWGEGYCCKACEAASLHKGERISEVLYDPTDPTGRRVVAHNADEVDAMIEANGIDARLPRIIYHLRAGWSFRKIGRAMRYDEKLIRVIVEKSAPMLLRRCGLRRKL